MRKFLIWVVMGCALWGEACAASQDNDFLAARDAFQQSDARRLERYAKRLQGYVLEPYVAYWQLRLGLDNASTAEVHRFLERYRETLLADRLRSEWLKVLAKKRQWQLFAEEYLPPAETDTELTCYVLQARLAHGEEAALAEAKPLWFNGRDMPESCTPLFEALINEKTLDAQDVWARLRLALEDSNVSVAKHIAKSLPKEQGFNSRNLDSANDNPQRFLDKKNYDLKTRAGRETTLFALARLARSSPQQAAAEWRKLGERFSEAERGYMWGQLAFHAARAHDPEALAWFDLAGALTDLHLVWKARAALRVKNWPAVLAAIDAMSPQEAREASWRYWKARALKAQGQIVDANALLITLANDYNFYGQLASEELGAVIGRPAGSYRPSKDEIKAAQQAPGIQRALAFYRLGLRYEGNLEWQRALRGFSDQQLLAAAEVARRNELYDRAINAADKTVQLHDFSLRYPAPYRDLMQKAAREMQLDEAWVYGLIRQESRFVSSARSGVGAIGLMQLMPATAKWVAKRLGLRHYRLSVVSELNTNIRLGAYYMKHVLETLDSLPLLASAAYNAGPRRARDWRPSEGVLEGAVYAETIPFSETRDYVKKVMSNANYYATQLEQQLQSLKQRLGVVTPHSKDDTLAEDEP